jgi:threonine dehydrogenase-like Zn-dependent dehydrogenase
VLVQAGAGGVGHVSVQLARLTGARVAATVSPGVKADLASSLGAELCIGYRHEDVGAKVRAGPGWTAPAILEQAARPRNRSGHRQKPFWLWSKRQLPAMSWARDSRCARETVAVMAMSSGPFSMSSSTVPSDVANS